MIVSHKYKFIYLRTEKTASTSLSTALEEILDTGDFVARPFQAKWVKRLPKSPGALKRHLPLMFGLHTHASASQARMVLGRKIFDSYYKFSVERNPWERQLSLYTQRIHKEEKHKTVENFDTDMRDWFWRARYYTRLKNWPIYAIGDQVVADHVIQYHDLETGLRHVFDQIGIESTIELPRFRTSPSGERAPYARYYSAATRDLVANWYEREIKAFGYSFEGEPAR
jgi:hypothetical protein